MVSSSKKTLGLELLLGLGLIGLALWLRITSLTHFVTADEHNWVYRSGLFLHAFLAGDWPGTSVWLTPAVTTTWLGSAGLTLFYWLNQATIDQPFAEWLISFSRNRIDLEELLILRWAMALFTAGMIGVIYGLARKLWSRPVALLGVLLMLTAPHLLAVSRIIGHDAPATSFITASLLSFLYARRSLPLSPATSLWQTFSRYRWFLFSGVMAGLAVLSKAPAMFLIPFVGLMVLVDLWSHRNRFKIWCAALLVWGAALWLTFVLVWPAAWASPLGQTWAVINNAFLYSAGLEEADTEPYWAIPNPGPFYYLLNGAFKLSPFVLIGLGLALFGGWRRLQHKSQPVSTLLNVDLFWLLLFSLLFGLFMTLGEKKSPRYILPAFPALAFGAAWGWLAVSKRLWTLAVILILAGLNGALTLNYAPYYFTYYNPLLGGGSTAQQLVRVGWGEGMDEIGRWLNQQPEAYAHRLGARYKVGLYPFYSGPLDSPVSEELDYVAFYIKQSQSGYPAPEILRYFEQQGALHRVILNGIDYGQIYQGPAMQPVEQTAKASLPLAFRPHTIYAPIGQTLTIDLLWPADNTQPAPGQPVTLALQSAEQAAPLESPAPVKLLGFGVKVSQHTFNIPPDTPRISYKLSIQDQSIGHIKARLLDIPADFRPLDFTARFLKLRGLHYQRQGDQFLIDLAWQSWPQEITDYTVYIQLLDVNGQRVAGVDIAPEPGFSILDRKEVMITHYSLPIPADLASGPYQLLVGLYYFAGDSLINVGSATLPEPVMTIP